LVVDKTMTEPMCAAIGRYNTYLLFLFKLSLAPG
jgi:hypothetical protein